METVLTEGAQDALVVVKPRDHVPPALEARQRVLQKCANQTIRVPNMLRCMPNWPCSFHGDMEEVRLQTDEWLKTFDVPETIKRKHREMGDYVIVTCIFFDDCPKDKLLILCKLMYWIFMFDDGKAHPELRQPAEIDASGALCSDRSAALKSCADMSTCIAACLSPRPTFSALPDARPTVRMICPILRDLRAGMAHNPSAMERLRGELQRYVEGVVRDQGVRHSGGLVDAWELFEVRVLDIGAMPFLILTEYARDFALPRWVRRHEAMEAILLQSSRLSVLGNEIISLQKELDSQVENMCFLLVHCHNITIQEAVATLLDAMRQHYDILNLAVQRLPWSTTDEHLNAAMRHYVYAAQSLATGTVLWSYLCRRYVKPNQIGEDFEAVLHLSYR